MCTQVAADAFQHLQIPHIVQSIMWMGHTCECECVYVLVFNYLYVSNFFLNLVHVYTSVHVQTMCPQGFSFIHSHTPYTHRHTHTMPCLGLSQKCLDLVLLSSIQVAGSIRGSAILVGSCLQQDLHALSVALPDGRQKGCDAVLVCGLHIGPFLQ